MTACEDAGDDEGDDFFLAEEDGVEALVEGAEVLCGSGDFGLGGVIHGAEIFLNWRKVQGLRGVVIFR